MLPLLPSLVKSAHTEFNAINWMSYTWSGARIARQMQSFLIDGRISFDDSSCQWYSRIVPRHRCWTVIYLFVYYLLFSRMSHRTITATAARASCLLTN